MAEQQQSPVNLEGAIYADFGADGLAIHWSGDTHGHVHKDDHGVKVEFASDCRQFIEMGGKRFHLRQFHFHHPSEHWVDGDQHTMELHVVHQNIDDGSLAVIGIFIEPGSEKGKVPSMLTQLASVLDTESDDDHRPQVSTSPREFLPKAWEQHFRYEGSLTTTPFTESVSWVVVNAPLTLPKQKLMKLLHLFRSTARFPLPLNRRYVLKTFDAPKSAKRK